MIQVNCKYTYGVKNITIRDFGDDTKLVMGKFCSIGRNVTVYLGGNHRTDWITTFPFGHIHENIFPYHGKGHPKTNGDVIIENDVWIGENVVIMHGVKIGSGAVIANNSHVVKDVEPYTIVGGNPACLIKNRFKSSQTRFLLDLKWWDKPIDEIQNLMPYLCQGDFNYLIEKLNNDKLIKIGF